MTLQLIPHTGNLQQLRREALRKSIAELPFLQGRLIEIASGHRLCRDNGMMITDLAAVENACSADRLTAKRTAVVFEFACNCIDQLRQHLPHVIRKIPAVGTGISDQLLS